jgi:hypothetical protein
MRGLFFFCYHALPRIRHSYARSIRCEPRNVASKLPKERKGETVRSTAALHMTYAPREEHLVKGLSALTLVELTILKSSPLSQDVQHAGIHLRQQNNSQYPVA